MPLYPRYVNIRRAWLVRIPYQHRPFPIGAQSVEQQQQQQQQQCELSRSRWATAQISRVHVTGVYHSIWKGQCHYRT
uniref:Uncharacterized protein n=1 Tax=Trichogramma kaykai TaxID=54128 RepID=A0ABD2WIC6_9HYME